MSVNTRVRSTPESVVVGDSEIQDQRNRTRLIREVTSQLEVPTSLTPGPSHVLCFYFVGCPKEVIQLLNHPVVNPFVTGVGGTGGNMIVKRTNSQLFCNHKSRVEETCLFILKEKAKARERRRDGVGVMKDKKLKSILKLFVTSRWIFFFCDSFA